MRQVFAEARRVLAKDGTCWINLGDSYAAEPPGQSEHAMRSSTLQSSGKQSAQMRESVRTAGVNRSKFAPRKNMLGIPWRTAFALQDDGWILRNEIIWNKPNAMPESVTDRLSSRHEHVFMLSRSPRYWFDLDAIREPHAAPERIAGATAFRARNASLTRTATGAYDGPGESGRNPGDVWSMATKPYPGAHLAAMPLELPIRCIKAGCRPGGTVLDPFSGGGTTGEAARRLGRRYIGIDLNAAYHDLAIKRYAQGVLDLSAGAA
jgi:site-specific DNA-methyltransferase (cytosine-N4-specific)